MALSGAPRFILFDEPAAGLSPTERGELIEILTGLPSHMGYIIIEHDMDVALRVSESVTMMHNGQIFKEGKPCRDRRRRGSPGAVSRRRGRSGSWLTRQHPALEIKDLNVYYGHFPMRCRV